MPPLFLGHETCKNHQGADHTPHSLTDMLCNVCWPSDVVYFETVAPAKHEPRSNSSHESCCCKACIHTALVTPCCNLTPPCFHGGTRWQVSELPDATPAQNEELKRSSVGSGPDNATAVGDMCPDCAVETVKVVKYTDATEWPKGDKWAPAVGLMRGFDEESSTCSTNDNFDTKPTAVLYETDESCTVCSVVEIKGGMSCHIQRILYMSHGLKQSSTSDMAGTSLLAHSHVMRSHTGGGPGAGTYNMSEVVMPGSLAVPGFNHQKPKEVCDSAMSGVVWLTNDHDESWVRPALSCDNEEPSQKISCTVKDHIIWYQGVMGTTARMTPNQVEWLCFGKA